MKAFTIDNPELISGLRNEIRRSDQSRYEHRLHSLLLLAQGMTCSEVAKLFDDSRRSVQYWYRHFEKEGLAGLVDIERPGRPKRLNDKQIRKIESALRVSPRESGMETNIWDGKTLSAFIKQQFNILLGVRQCQRLFRQLGFRLRKPRPLIAQADPKIQKTYKKTKKISCRSQFRPRDGKFVYSREEKGFNGESAAVQERKPDHTR
jgi:transposase